MSTPHTHLDLSKLFSSRNSVLEEGKEIAESNGIPEVGLAHAGLWQ